MLNDFFRYALPRNPLITRINMHTSFDLVRDSWLPASDICRAKKWSPRDVPGLEMRARGSGRRVGMKDM